MKFKWAWDEDSRPMDVDLFDMHRVFPTGRARRVGWVRTRKTMEGNTFYISMNWVSHDVREEVPYNTRRQAMRALRTEYIMYVVGGGLNERTSDET